MKKKKRERDSERHSEDTQLYRGEKGRKKKVKETTTTTTTTTTTVFAATLVMRTP